MKLKHSTLLIPEQTPFQFDKLEREPHAKMLTQFISSIEEPLTMSVEAGWGHGKTTFFRMWAQHLKNENFSCISFNAWEGDYSDDPFIPFVSEIRKAMTEVKGVSGEVSGKLADISELLRRTAVQVAKRTLPVAAKVLTAGLLDTDAIIEQAAGDAIAKAIEHKFDAYDADRKSLDNFKAALTSAVKVLKEQGRKSPLIFMIDELDRCRPTYALALLERIKHIFNVEGIVFVLAIDREQLLESIRTVYGSQTDAGRYLRRFVDYRYSLPDPKPDKYPHHLMSAMNFRDQFARVTGDANAGNHFLETFIALSTCFGMRLRDQEHAFSVLTVVWRTLDSWEDINPFILAALLVLKVADEGMYSKLVKREINVQKLFDHILKSSAGVKFMNENYGYVFEAYMSVGTETDEAVAARVEDLKMRAAQSDAHSDVAQKAHIFQNIGPRGSGRQSFDKVVKSLEMASQFKN